MVHQEDKLVTTMDKDLAKKGSDNAFLGGYQTVWIAPEVRRAPVRLKKVTGTPLGRLREEREEPEEEAWESYTDTEYSSLHQSHSSDLLQRRAPRTVGSLSFRAVVYTFAALGTLLLVGTLFVLYNAEPFEPLHSLSPDSVKFSYTVATAVLLFLWMIFFLIVFVTCRYCPMHDSNCNRMVTV